MAIKKLKLKQIYIDTSDGQIVKLIVLIAGEEFQYGYGITIFPGNNFLYDIGDQVVIDIRKETWEEL